MASSTATNALRRRRAKEVAAKDGSDKKRGIEGEVLPYTPPAPGHRPQTVAAAAAVGPVEERFRLGRVAKVSRSFGKRRSSSGSGTHGLARLAGPRGCAACRAAQGGSVAAAKVGGAAARLSL